MLVCIKLKDPELVGEVLHVLTITDPIYQRPTTHVLIHCIAVRCCALCAQALWILGAKDSDPAMIRGTRYMLEAEQRVKGQPQGRWVATTSSFHKRYHATYCALIGLAQFEFEPRSKRTFRQDWAPFFSGPHRPPQ